MELIIGILIGALIIGFIWAFVYLEQEIHDLKAELRMRTHPSTYRPYRYTEPEIKPITYQDMAKKQVKESEKKKEEYQKMWEEDVGDDDDLDDFFDEEDYPALKT